jgi:hypothetical protein
MLVSCLVLQLDSEDIGQSPTLRRFLLPVDEGNANETFRVFRDELHQAAARGDLKAVLAVTSPDVMGNFGPDPKGYAALRREWSIERSPTPFLEELQRVLSLGGTWSSSTEFVAPYVATLFPDDEFAPEDHLVVTFGGARLRQHPRSDARTVAILSFEIVRFERIRDERWYQATTLNGLKGFLLKEEARSPYAHRAHFVQLEGKWMMTAFIAGD